MSELQWLTEQLTGRNRHQFAVRLFRIGLYAFLLVNTLLLLPIAPQIWSPEGFMLPQSNWDSPIFALLNLLANPGFENLWPWFIAGQIAFLLLGLWGQWPRLAAIGIWFFSANLIHRGTELSNGGYHMLSLFLFYQLFISSREVKKDTFWGGLTNLCSNLGMWAIRLQVVALYATAGLYKLIGTDWISGDAMGKVLQVPFFTHPIAMDYLVPMEGAMKLASWLVLAFQVSFPLLVWFRKLRPWVLGAGTFFHLSIVFVVGLADFGLVMLVSYLAFHSEASAAYWGAKLTFGRWSLRPKLGQSESR